MSGYNFGIVMPQLQQQQPTLPTSLFDTLSRGGATDAAVPTASLLGSSLASTNNPGFNFQNIHGQSQLSASTNFAIGSLTGSITSPLESPFGCGTSIETSSLAKTTSTTIQSNASKTSPVRGLGGTPYGAGSRLSMLLASETNTDTSWHKKNDNRAVQELPVPPEIIAVVKELNSHIKKHKSIMRDASQSIDLDADSLSVAEQVEEVRISLTALETLMHKQELQSALLIKDMQQLGKEMDLLSQAKDDSTCYESTSATLNTFLLELLEKYSEKMLKYKAEIEQAEISLQTIVGAYNANDTDLLASLTTIKDTVVLLAAQIQHTLEEVHNELKIHKQVSEVLYACPPKPWLANALSGCLETHQNVPPLERVLSAPSKLSITEAMLETMHQQTYSILNCTPLLKDPQIYFAPSTGNLMQTPSNNTALSCLPSETTSSASTKTSPKRPKK